MKKIILLTCMLILLGITSFSQDVNDYIFFTGNDEPFFLSINGKQYNSVPATNVVVRDIAGQRIVVKIKFANETLGSFTSNFWANQEEGDVEYTIQIKNNKKNQPVLSLTSYVPRTNQQAANSQITNDNTNATYENADNYIVKPNANQQNNTDIGANTNMNLNVGVNDSGVSMNVVIDDKNLGLNMQVNEGQVSQNNHNSNNVVNTNTTTTNNSNSVVTTTTTTITTTTTNSGAANNQQLVPLPTQDNNSTVIKPSANTRCPHAMSNSDFEEAMTSIFSKSFEDSKLSLAKQICKNSCLTAEQIAKINKKFSFEDTRLEFAKYAYDYVYDVAKYYKVNDAFTFESSIESLDKYIKSK